MGSLVNLSGQRFGHLVVCEQSPERTKHGGVRWICQCDCGATTITPSGDLRGGHTVSCGCHRLKVLASGRASVVRHGHAGLTRTPEYRAWDSMRDRCCNPRHPAFHRYGGRGITICAEWRSGFEQFFADMGPRTSPKHTLERRDNDRGYSPDNCYWATWTEQHRNYSYNRVIEHGGRRMPVSAWCEEYGLTHATLTNRLNRGWSVSDALTIPIGQRATR